MEDFSSTGQLVTLGLVDSSIGATAEGLALVDVEALIVKDMLLSLKHSLGHGTLPLDIRTLSKYFTNKDILDTPLALTWAYHSTM